MNPPVLYAISKEQFEALEKMRVEFAEVKRKVDLLSNRPELQQWVTKAEIRKQGYLGGRKSHKGVSPILDQLVADKKLRVNKSAKATTYNLTDLLLFSKI